MNTITKYVESYFGIESQQFDKIADFFSEKQIEKGEYLLKSGRYQTTLGFIKSGYIRIFNVDANSGKEITQWISMPGSFVADASSLFFDTPAKWDNRYL